MRKLVLLILVVTILIPLSFTGKVEANTQIKVQVFGGKYLNFDQPPVLIKNRVLVPLRGVFEELGATVKWDSKMQTVKATSKAGTVVELVVNSNKALVNGKSYNLDTPATIRGNRVLVPIRFVSEALGASVEWDSKYKVVIINTVTYEMFKAIKLGETLLDDVEKQYGRTAFHDLNMDSFLLHGTSSIILEVGEWGKKDIISKSINVSSEDSIGSGYVYPEVTQANYKKLKDSMSLETASAILGGQGILVHDSFIKQSYLWFGKPGRAFLSFTKPNNELDLENSSFYLR